MPGGAASIRGYRVGIHKASRSTVWKQLFEVVRKHIFNEFSHTVCRNIIWENTEGNGEVFVWPLGTPQIMPSLAYFGQWICKVLATWITKVSWNRSKITIWIVIFLIFYFFGFDNHLPACLRKRHLYTNMTVCNGHERDWSDVLRGGSDRRTEHRMQGRGKPRCNWLWEDRISAGR